MNKDTLDKMIKMWNEGYLTKEIAREIGYEVGSVSYVIYTKRKLFPYRLGRISKEDRDRYANMVINGEISCKRAASEAGVHVNTIRRWVKRVRDGKA